MQRTQWRIQKGAWGATPSKIGKNIAKLTHFLPILASMPSLSDHPGSDQELHGSPGFNPFACLQLLSSDIPSFFRKVSKIRIAKYCVHILNQHGECIKMSANMPIFGSLVLKIACDTFTNKKTSSNQ